MTPIERLQTALNGLGLKAIEARLESRAIKRRVNAKQGFRDFQSARRTILGYEAIKYNSEGPSVVDEREWRPAAESIHQHTPRIDRLRFRVTHFLSELFLLFSKLATLPWKKDSELCRTKVAMGVEALVVRLTENPRVFVETAGQSDVSGARLGMKRRRISK